MGIISDVFPIMTLRGGEFEVAANLIDEIRATEEKAAKSVQEAGAEVARRLNQATADAENAIKEAKQSATKQFREKIQMAERTAEAKARNIVSERESEARTFYAGHRDKISKVAGWITEEVMVRYGRG
jgi:vacuolar-type H+-ATPase subunit H